MGDEKQYMLSPLPMDWFLYDKDDKDYIPEPLLRAFRQHFDEWCMGWMGKKFSKPAINAKAYLEPYQTPITKCLCENKLTVKNR